MNIKLETKKLAAIVSATAAAAMAKVGENNQILVNIVLKAENGKMVAYGSDLEIGITASVAIDSQDDFICCVNARKLNDIVKALTADTVTLTKTVKTQTNENNKTVSSETVLLKAGKSKFTLQSANANDFPTFANDKSAIATFTHESDIFHDILKSVKFAAPTNDIRYYLNGVLLEVYKDGKAVFVATDGNRLAFNTIDTQVKWLDENTTMQPSILPNKTVNELMKITAASDEISVTLQENLIVFTAKVGECELEVISKVIGGKFPDYNRVIPHDSDFSSQIKIDCLETLEAIKRVELLGAGEKLKTVHIQAEPNQAECLLQGQNKEQETAEELISMQFTGDEAYNCSFNTQYLSEALNIFAKGKPELLISSSSNEKPTLMTIANDEKNAASSKNFKYVVMPLKA